MAGEHAPAGRETTMGWYTEREIEVPLAFAPIAHILSSE